jgi:hypothetical protein
MLIGATKTMPQRMVRYRLARYMMAMPKPPILRVVIPKNLQGQPFPGL